MSYYEYHEGSIIQKENKKNITSSISFSIDKGQTLAIIGQSGSGKTLTALSIMGLLPNNLEFDGYITRMDERIDSKKLKELLGKEIVYIPQNGHEFLNPSLTVKSQLNDQRRLNKSTKAIDKALEEAGFKNPSSILKMYPFELSGGMAQGVTIAMALLSNPKLIIADEATNGLNYEDARGFINGLNRLFEDSAKIVITHDLNIASMCDSILVLYKGRQIEYGRSNDVINSNHPYIEALRESRVSNGMKATRLYEEDNL